MYIACQHCWLQYKKQLLSDSICKDCWTYGLITLRSLLDHAVLNDHFKNQIS